MIHKELLNKKLSGVLVYDIECYAPYDIRKEFDEYVKNAIVKWVGCYSYKYNKYIEFNALEQRQEIIDFFKDHDTLVGFNNEKFDTPIMQNNNLIKKGYVEQLDIQIILGVNDSLGHKKRSNYMNVSLEEVYIDGKRYSANTLMSMAYYFKLDMLKGDIDYKIFKENTWTEKEEQEIKKYLESDVMITKQLFDRTFNFWIMFTDWLYEKDIKNWNWLRTTIASLTYLAACKVKGVEPTYDKPGEKEPMGGRSIEPPQEETFKAWYMDEASKYPHIFAEFNLFNEIDVSKIPVHIVEHGIKQGKIFHGNDKFKVRGYYDIRKQGVLEQDVLLKLKRRFAIKRMLKEYKKTGEHFIQPPDELKEFIPGGELTDAIIDFLKGMEYAIKIFLNALYGAARTKTFEQIYSKNCGWDCCWIGQQIHEYVDIFFRERGFKLVGGFTDSWFIEYKEGYTKDDVMQLASECMNELKKYMPFPADTHVIAYECFIDYVVYHYDDKKKEYKKNNYAMIRDDIPKVKIVGFPIMKSNATRLGILVFRKYLDGLAMQKKRIKFERDFIEKCIREELEKDITLAAVNVSCNKAHTYKGNCLQKQVSLGYLDGLDGSLQIIKNKRYGKVGVGKKYCTVKEAIDCKLTYEDLILDKVWNELDPFILHKQGGLGDFF